MEKAQIAKKGPYILDMEPGTYFWCSCGKSSKQPFCDGSHAGSTFLPTKTMIAEPKKVAWCGCKQSTNGVFCDGTHTKV